MKIRNILFIFVGLIICFAFNQGSETSFDVDKSEGEGQYLLTLKHINSDRNVDFRVFDMVLKKSYPAQFLNDSTLLVLTTDPDLANKTSIVVKESLQGFSKDNVLVLNSDEEIKVTKDGKPVLAYQKAERLKDGQKEYYRRSGFIHPLYSPNGIVLSDDFPEDHAHQHSVYFAFVNTTFKGEMVDFWNQQKKSGTIKFSKLLSHESGPVFGKFVTEQDHISIMHGNVLKEKWEVTVYNTEPYQIDIKTTLHNISSDTLFVNEYKYGGMAFRGAKEWNKADTLNFQNEAVYHSSDGHDRITGNHARPLWSSLSGKVNGDEAGVAVFGYPSNFRHPEPVRIHPEMPYFCLAPMVGEDFMIAPDKVFEAKYTLLSFDGSVPVELLDKSTNGGE